MKPLNYIVEKNIFENEMMIPDIPGTIEELEKAITAQDSKTGCITIARSLDGRLQVTIKYSNNIITNLNAGEPEEGSPSRHLLSTLEVS